MTSMQAMFAGLSQVCFDKCVQKYKGQGELTVGEEVCTDRCVLKYFEATALVGQTMQEQQDRMAQQQQAQVPQ